MLEIRSEQIQYVKDMLDDLPGNKTNTALRNAASRAMQTARSEIWQSVRKEYTVKRTQFYKETNISVFKATGTTLGAGIRINGYLLPLIDFQVSNAVWVPYYKNQPEEEQLSRARYKNARHHFKGGGRYTRLTVEVFRGNRTPLKHAYIANLGTYGEAIFERLAPRRDSSSQLYGPSAAHMAQNAEVSDNIMTAVQETFDKRLEHEIDRILRGYSGYDTK